MKKKAVARYEQANYFRNFVFGVEDSLVSTVGLVSGVAVAGVPGHTIFVTGVVLIFVEAFSMGVGSFISDSNTNEYVDHIKIPFLSLFISSTVMFISYLISGIVPLFPYLIFQLPMAFAVSIGLTLLFLFLLGVVSAYRYGANILRNGTKTIVLGGLAIFVGVVVGKFVV